jgi:hypothetical protein
MAPEVGFEPTTNRLTADRSTTELLWIGNVRRFDGRICDASDVHRQAAISATNRPTVVDHRHTRREWLRGRDLNPRPSGYEPDELPGCSTPRLEGLSMQHRSESATVKTQIADLISPTKRNRIAEIRFDTE